MTPEAQRISIAEACGWRRTMYQSPSQIPAGVPFWCKEDAFVQSEYLPDFLSDLNAMHEAENTLLPDEFSDYLDCLRKITQSEHRFEVENRFALVNATAAHRAEAFLRTLNLWEGANP